MSNHTQIIMASVLMGAVAIFFGMQTQTDPDRGQVVFETVCSTCHSMSPPVTLAPPMLMVAGHYAGADVDDPWGMMANWIASPDSAKSMLPSHAIERFGLMPPLPLAEGDAEAVVAYIRQEFLKTPSEDESAVGECQMEGEMREMGQMRGMGGMGGMRQRMQNPDSTRRGMGQMRGMGGMRQRMQNPDSTRRGMGQMRGMGGMRQRMQSPDSIKCGMGGMLRPDSTMRRF
jgi:mono/diheme cytochrome c family protein